MEGSPSTGVLFGELLNFRFFLNCLISLIATIWLPIARLDALVEGKVVSSRTIRLYEIYWSILNPAETQLAHLGRYWGYIAVHWAVIFVMTLAVWYFVMRWQRRREAQDRDPVSGNEI